MSENILYVLGGRLPSNYFDQVETSNSPQSEFSVFIKRNHAQIMSLSDIPSPRSFAGRFLSGIQGGRLPLAWKATRGKHAAIVTSGEDIGLPLALATMRLRRPPPVLIVLHGAYIETRKFRIILGVLKHARHVHLLCLSEALRKGIITRFGFPSDRCHGTGYGVDTDFFSVISPICPPSPLIVSAGASNRDYPTLVAATETLNVPVKIAAASSWMTGPSGIEGVPLPAHVEAKSYGNYLNLRDLYASASIVVVPLVPVNFASGYAVIAEAMAMGRPVIVTRTAAISDFVMEDETGIYVEPGDVAGMRAAIQSLLADPDRREAMGRAGRARMEKLFDLSAYSARIEAVIKQAQDALSHDRQNG